MVQPTSVGGLACLASDFLNGFFDGEVEGEAEDLCEHKVVPVPRVVPVHLHSHRNRRLFIRRRHRPVYRKWEICVSNVTNNQQSPLRLRQTESGIVGVRFGWVVSIAIACFMPRASSPFRAMVL